MQLTYVEDLWDDAEAAAMDEAELLRYRSNLLGRDLRLTNFGGGNTSAKIPTVDPATGETVDVLWVKGSGGDLGTINRSGFATLYLDRLNALKRQYRGVEHEDEMAEMLPLCAFAANPRAASIDTPLHGFLPYRHVDHLHPDWAIALAACANGPRLLPLLQEETGIGLIWLPWKRPGFELGLWLERAAKEHPEADGVILGSHGIFTWGDTSRQSYLNTLRVIDGIGRFVVARVEKVGARLFGGQALDALPDRAGIAAAALPALRGLVGDVLATYDGGDAVMRFIDSREAKRLAWLGTSCPDHFVRTKVRPMFAEWDTASGSAEDLVAAARAGMDAYRQEYARYYEDNRQPDSPAMRSPNPTVILAPGIGMFSFGRSKPEARITGEFYINAIHVMEGATALDEYTALPPREAFNIEYWLLEEAKLKRLPPEKELSRKVALVVGAGPGIGLTICDRLAREGSCVVAADIRPELAEATAEAVRKAHGRENAASVAVDCTDRASVHAMLKEAVRAFGGVDILVFVAAVFFTPGSSGRTTDDEWRKTIDVNLTGAMIVADEAHRIMAAQGSAGSIVLIGSANGVVAKKGSWAYDVSKAALNHLVREMAVEFAPEVRVNGVAPASVVEGSLQFPRERVLTSLAKYGIAFDESESTEALRDKLSDYYSRRTLLHQKVTPAAVAEACFLLASNRLGLTTGQVLPVDAGLPEAFLR